MTPEAESLFSRIWKSWPCLFKGSEAAGRTAFSAAAEAVDLGVLEAAFGNWIKSERRTSSSVEDFFLVAWQLFADLGPGPLPAVAATAVLSPGVSSARREDRSDFERVLAKWPPFCPPDNPEQAWAAWRACSDRAGLLAAAEMYADTLTDPGAGVIKHCKQLARFAADPRAVADWKDRARGRISEDGAAEFAVVWGSYPGLAAREGSEPETRRWWVHHVSAVERFDFLCAMRAYLGDTKPEFVSGFSKFVAAWKAVDRGHEVHWWISGPLRCALAGKDAPEVWPDLSLPIRALCEQGKLAPEILAFIAAECRIEFSDIEIRDVMQRAFLALAAVPAVC